MRRGSCGAGSCRGTASRDCAGARSVRSPHTPQTVVVAAAAAAAAGRVSEARVVSACMHAHTRIWRILSHSVGIRVRHSRRHRYYSLLPTRLDPTESPGATLQPGDSHAKENAEMRSARFILPRSVSLSQHQQRGKQPPSHLARDVLAARGLLVGQVAHGARR